MIGQSHSFSQNAGMIRFEGGPYSGQLGLFDSNCIDTITFCHTDEKRNHSYVPVKKCDSWVYRYSGCYEWGKP